MLEGSGLAFDALWVAGLSADRWPPPPAPNPLLPLHWQRERNVPRATAQGELAYARALTSRFAMAAAEVVFSSAAAADDLPLAPSALLLDFPEFTAPPQSVRTWTQAIAASAKLDNVTDNHATAFVAGTTAPGGVGIVTAQSDCVLPSSRAPPDARGGMAIAADRSVGARTRDVVARDHGRILDRDA